VGLGCRVSSSTKIAILLCLWKGKSNKCQSHDIDNPTAGDQGRVNIMVARGLLVESNNPTWLYGTAVEHAILYQYQFYNASNIIAGMIQTESSYFQGANGIEPPAPYGSQLGKFPGDPTWSVDQCVTGAAGKRDIEVPAMNKC